MKFPMMFAIAVLFLVAPSIIGKEQGYGSLLHGDNGKFRYKPQAAEDGKKDLMGTQGASATIPTITSTTTTTPAATTTTSAPLDIETSIYFTTVRRGVSAFSPERNQTKKIVNSTEYLDGITYDSINDKLYFSSYYKIYRSNKDGTEVETVYINVAYGYIEGLAFDWIGGNVYVVTSGGYILACGAGALRSFSCYTILDGQNEASGIRLDPTEGMMYWTRDTAGSIQRAGMDGSSPLTLVSGLNRPVGVTIDFASRRLYWTEYFGSKIQSSHLDGRDIQLVVQLRVGSGPWGIAILKERIYWGNLGDNKLQSSTKDGQDIQTLHTETDNIYHLATVAIVDQPTTRTNDCEKRNCSTLCVLATTSYRCLD